MAFNNEIEEVKAQIKVLEKKLALLEEIEKQPPQPQMNLQQEGEYAVVSYNDKVYYRLQGDVTFSWYIKKGVSVGYPVPTLMMVNDPETERLLEGLYYNHIQVKKEKVVEEQEVREWDVVRESMNWCKDHPGQNPLDWLKPQTPEETEQSLKEAFVKAQQTEKWKEIQKLIDEEDNDKNFKNSLDLIKEWGEKNKPKTLYQICMEWWDDTFTKKETSLQELVDRIDKEFIPPNSNSNDYQWNKCLELMRNKLR